MKRNHYKLIKIPYNNKKIPYNNKNTHYKNKNNLYKSKYLNWDKNFNKDKQQDTKTRTQFINCK